MDINTVKKESNRKERDSEDQWKGVLVVLLYLFGNTIVEW